jgi:hypothetical protein
MVSLGRKTIMQGNFAMTTIAKRTANQRNAQLSTGPRTEGGKVVARMNAMNHGLRAASPTVPGESPELWEEFRDAVLLDLAPAGVLEAELAERVATLSWRLRRVSAFEAGMIARNSDRTVRRLRGEEDDDAIGNFTRTKERRTLASVQSDVTRWKQNVDLNAKNLRLFNLLMNPADNARFSGTDTFEVLSEIADSAAPAPSYLTEDDEDFDELDEDQIHIDPRHTDVSDTPFLRAVGVPDDFLDEWQNWDGWNVTTIRMGVQLIAKKAGKDPTKLLARAVKDTTEALDENRVRVANSKRELKEMERVTAVEEAEARKRVMVPMAETTEVVMRYEGHLQKQLMTTLNLLERMRAARSPFPPPPPLALDVTIGA